MDDALVTAWRHLPPQAELARSWRDLEARSDASFFLSWAWIATWLAMLPPSVQPRLLQATRGGRLVGMGLLVPGWTRRCRWLPVRCWLLHESGLPALDTLTIEYNDFLLDRDGAAGTRLAMVKAVSQALGRRLKLEAGVPAFQQLAEDLPPDLVFQGYSRPCHWVDLEIVRQAKGGFLGVLSGNRRSQIRQGLKAYEQLGVLTLQPAADLPTARHYLDRLFALHAQTWAARGEASEFTGAPLARAFHERLLDDAFSQGALQLLRVSAGDAEVAYLYNFVHRGRVIAYQAGMRYGLLPRHDQPGYVAHALAIDHNAAQGLACYDFLAGQGAYKEWLSTDRCWLHWCEVEPRTWATALEARLKPVWRSAKRRWEPAVPSREVRR
jgi:CelD/BcsL family acetyltransferase involved in cellulose biosynthesis